MALNVEAGTIVAPGSTGNQTYNLPSAFDCKALFLFTNYQTGDGAADSDAICCFGMGTYEGGAAQALCSAIFDDDAVATSAVVRVPPTASPATPVISSGVADNSTTIDWSVSLVSLGSASFVLNWTDLPGTGSLRFHYLALGGSAIEAARVISYQAGQNTATDDVTVATGWGRPDHVFLLSGGWSLVPPATDAARMGFGAATRNSAGDAYAARAALYALQAAGANMTLGTWTADRLNVFVSSTIIAYGEADLDQDRTAWPTDGFRIAWPDPLGFRGYTAALAIKAPNLKLTIDSIATPTAGAPQTTNLAAFDGTTPRGALLWGTNISTDGLNTTDADTGGFWAGATDGTNEWAAGVVNDNGNTTSCASGHSSTSKAIQQYVAAAGGGAAALNSEADSSISGGNVVLTWGDTDTVARLVNYVVFGEVTPGQVMRPDADTTTTGWTATPLYSKLNDESDATVVTATLA